MMNVQQLIDMLQNVEDKSTEVRLQIDSGFNSEIGNLQHLISRDEYDCETEEERIVSVLVLLGTNLESVTE